MRFHNNIEKSDIRKKRSNDLAQTHQNLGQHHVFLNTLAYQSAHVSARILKELLPFHELSKWKHQKLSIWERSDSFTYGP